MITDLYLSKEEQLEIWCKEKKLFTSHDVNFYGTTNFFDSATRRIREWVDEGKVRRLDESEKVFRGYHTKCAVYEYVGGLGRRRYEPLIATDTIKQNGDLSEAISTPYNLSAPTMITLK